MKKIIVSLILGIMIFSLVFSLGVIGILSYCYIVGVRIDHEIIRMALVRSAKGGIAPGVAMALIFMVSWPRRHTPGGR